MTNRFRELLKDPEARRAFEEELLIGEVTDTVVEILESLNLSQRELADRLGVTEGRVSQILAGSGNLTLRSLAALAWALGLRFELEPRALADRRATPADSDPPAPAWLSRPGGQAQWGFVPGLRAPDHLTPSPKEFKQRVSEGRLHVA
jgi:transcriptional regulator with XRE-family HTH domain